MASQPLASGDSAGTIMGHPKGLFVLFFAEMWERFSYYGMRALLIFYLVKHWMFSDGEASIIYGAYTALVYITPVIGGYLADRYLGQRKAVLYGAVLLTLGHFFMAFEGQAGVGHVDNPIINIFWLALALIIVGSGFLKANISVIVGQLYPRTDVRRDPAYTIFYMGINIGAFLGSLLCGYIGETYGWAYGFGLAGIGMLLGLVVFVWGTPLLLGRGEPPKPLSSGTEWGMYAIGIGLVAVCWALVQLPDLVGWGLGVFGTAIVTTIIYYSMYVLGGGTWTFDKFAKTLTAITAGLIVFGFLIASVANLSGSAALSFINHTVFEMMGYEIPVWGVMALIGLVGMIVMMVQQVLTVAFEDRDRIFAALFLILVSIVFWALFEQAGSSLNLFTDRHVDRNIFGFEAPASMFQSVNAAFIFMLAPLFAIAWLMMGRRGIEPSTPMKFGLGVVQVGLGFLILVWGAQAAGLENPTPVIFIFLIYLLHTTGELCLSPVGLSAMNRLPPKHLASIMMGTWFLASATGNFAAGLIARATGAEGVGEEAGKQVVLDVYGTVGWTAIAIGVGVILVSPMIKKLMHLDTLQDDEPTLEGAAEAGLEAQEGGIHPTSRKT